MARRVSARAMAKEWESKLKMAACHEINCSPNYRRDTCAA